MGSDERRDVALFLRAICKQLKQCWGEWVGLFSRGLGMALTGEGEGQEVFFPWDELLKGTARSVLFPWP